MNVSTLFNVLVSTFAVMLLGFLLPKVDIVDRQTVGKGLGTLVAKLLLPAVLFKQMADLHLGSMDLEVVLSMLLSKVALFVVTGLLWLWTDSSPNRGQKASLAAIAVCNQSDTAIGLAVLPAMFAGVGPDFEAYVAVGIAMNLLVVVPIGMTLIFALAPDAEDRSIGKVASEALLNPIVAASVCGLAVNLLKGSQSPLPDVVKMSVDIPASAFSCCALFMVGHGILEATLQNGNEASLKEALFIAVLKLLIMPIVLQTTLKFFNKDDELLEFGYIYGTVPTAPSTIVVAHQAGLPIGTVCYAIMIGTLAWGPLCFAGAIIFNVGLNQESEVGIEYISLCGDFFSLLSVVYLIVSEVLHRQHHHHDDDDDDDTQSVQERVPSPMQRYFFLCPLLVAIAVFSSFDIVCRTLHAQYYFVISDVARQASSSLACLLVVEGLLQRHRCSMILKWGGVLLCLAVPAAATAYYEASGMEMVPDFQGRCWWRWPIQQQVEVIFDVALLLILGLVIWHERKTLAATAEERVTAAERERRQREAGNMTSPLLPGESRGEERRGEEKREPAGGEERGQGQEEHASEAACPDTRLEEDQQDPHNTEEEAWGEAAEESIGEDDTVWPRPAGLEGFAVLSGLRILCMLFILVNVNGNNSGAAGWTVVLIIATVLVSSFGCATALFFKSPAYRTTDRIVGLCEPCKGRCEDYCDAILRSQSSARSREVQHGRHGNVSENPAVMRRSMLGSMPFGNAFALGPRSG